MPVKVFYFPNLIYNCEKPFYRLTPLPDSIISEGLIFAFDFKKLKKGVLALALNLNSDVDDKNYYKSIERLKNLVCLSYSSIPNEIVMDDQYSSLQEAIDKNLVDKFYEPGLIFGEQLDQDLPLRIAAYSQKIVKLSTKDQKKFWQSLQTFSYARFIAHLSNPQYKYTLYMTLHLSSINQLANKRQNLHNSSVKLFCPECNKEVNMTHQTSHVEEIIKLIEELIPKPHDENFIKLVKKLYHPVRSEFIHEGNFAGSEDLGGFIGLWGDPIMKQISESDINLQVINRSLLEQFLVKKALK